MVITKEVIHVATELFHVGTVSNFCNASNLTDLISKTENYTGYSILMPPTGKQITAISLLIGTSLAFSFPVYITYHNRILVEQGQGLSTGADKALPVNANSRGVFINSGSKDIGRDPKWDTKTGRRER